MCMIMQTLSIGEQNHIDFIVGFWFFFGFFFISCQMLTVLYCFEEDNKNEQYLHVYSYKTSRLHR